MLDMNAVCLWLIQRLCRDLSDTALEANGIYRHGCDTEVNLYGSGFLFV
jgi:hypothetical protein